jgi:hypothetical protein
VKTKQHILLRHCHVCIQFSLDALVSLVRHLYGTVNCSYLTLHIFFDAPTSVYIELCAQVLKFRAENGRNRVFEMMWTLRAHFRCGIYLVGKGDVNSYWCKCSQYNQIAGVASRIHLQGV